MVTKMMQELRLPKDNFILSDRIVYCKIIEIQSKVLSLNFSRTHSYLSQNKPKILIQVTLRGFELTTT